MALVSLLDREASSSDACVDAMLVFPVELMYLQKSLTGFAAADAGGADVGVGLSGTVVLAYQVDSPIPRLSPVPPPSLT